jgi:hypothetical protein
LFSLLPTKIGPHQTAILCVSAVHAIRLSVSHLGNLPPARTTCRNVRPPASTLYVVQALNQTWSTIRRITLTVRPDLVYPQARAHLQRRSRRHAKF